jgi:cell division protein FtsI/penicillin-binding protein 2
VIARERLKISKKTRMFLQESMYETIQLGTAKMFRSLSAFKLFGKTGTAQTIKLQNQQTFKTHREHGWFALFFQYKNERPLVLVVLVEHAGSSLPARDIAKKFLKEYEKRAQALFLGKK